MNPIETHEKNLAWVDDEIKSISEQFISDEGYTNSLRANRKTLERHGPETRYVVSDDGGSFDTEEEALDSFIGAFDSPAEEELARSEAKACLTTFTLCSACAEINNSAMEDADEWVYLPEVYFPCPTYTDISDGLGISR